MEGGGGILNVIFQKKGGDPSPFLRPFPWCNPFHLNWGAVIPKTFKNGSGRFLHGTHDEGGTTKHDWSAPCQLNVTGWVSMWAYDMLSQ